MERHLHHCYRASLLLAFAFSALAQPGKVIGIVDGDTIEVLWNRQPLRVRLNGIDAPEKRQAFGTRSQEAIAGLCFGKIVTVMPRGKDRYGRVLAEIALPGGASLNRQMVRDGYAWWYRKYAPKDTVLRRLEEEARDARRGLWLDPEPIPPWEWRRLRKE